MLPHGTDLYMGGHNVNCGSAKNAAKEVLSYLRIFSFHNWMRQELILSHRAFIHSLKAV